MYDYDPGGWGFALMFVGMALFWALLIAGIVLLTRYVDHSGHTPVGTPSARHGAEKMLAERFARVEIDQDEYRNRLAILRGERRTERNSRRRRRR
ncbi:hypothetical protein FXW78_43155 [Rhodococcus opacus]|nr:hypothetical protein [Rhodococcus opacus]RZL83294.1 MAG: hypothetical protein EOP32_08210 [Rhodococcus sp. (in: high G+C Gram-positive bacteria)]